MSDITTWGICYSNTVVFGFVEESPLIAVSIRNMRVKLTVKMLR